MADRSFPRLVSLACHDLRTPLATVFGFARTLQRSDGLDERSARFIGMIEEASEQMTELLDGLGIAARIEAGRWDPALRPIDTLELVESGAGTGETIETEVDAVSSALRSLAAAARRHGPVEQVTWTVAGRELRLEPITPAAGPVVLGVEERDLGSLVARLVIEELGGSLELTGETLLVRV
jgi:signal transduction histidine kinase